MLFSESDNNASFSLDLHAQILTDSLLDNNRAWIQYLQDHRQLIIKHSTTATINETVMSTCRNREYIVELRKMYVTLRNKVNKL